MNNLGVDPTAGTSSTLAPGTVHALVLGCCTSVIACSSKLLDGISELGFTKKKKRFTTRVVVLETCELIAVVFKGSHFFHAKTCKLAIKRMDSIPRLAVNLHDFGCILHIRQALQKLYFFLEHLVGINNGWSVTAESMRNDRIESVGKLLNSLSHAHVVLGGSKIGVVEQSCKVLQLLETSVEGGHCLLEILLVEDKFHQLLDGLLEFAFRLWGLILILPVLLLDSLVIFVVRFGVGVRIVATLDKSVFARSGIGTTVIPGEARLVLKFLLKNLDSVIKTSVS
ncbi:hypothetical protein HG531_006603 [Fusarium graminearum]|nr:hypothetical protein HG531_006603 [Fusarium graminearum]